MSSSGRRRRWRGSIERDYVSNIQSGLEHIEDATASAQQAPLAAVLKPWIEAGP
jgi:hypothetical protein